MAQASGVKHASQSVTGATYFVFRQPSAIIRALSLHDLHRERHAVKRFSLRRKQSISNLQDARHRQRFCSVAGPRQRAASPALGGLTVCHLRAPVHAPGLSAAPRTGCQWLRFSQAGVIVPAVLPAGGKFVARVYCALGARVGCHHLSFRFGTRPNWSVEAMRPVSSVVILSSAAGRTPPPLRWASRGTRRSFLGRAQLAGLLTVHAHHQHHHAPGQRGSDVAEPHQQA